MLDASTVNELNNLAKSVIKSPTKGPKSPNTSNNKNRVGQSSSSIGTGNPLQSKRKDGVSPKKTVYYCKDHSE